MQLNLDDSKEKPKRRGRTAPIDFVVSLQLEECTYQIELCPTFNSQIILNYKLRIDCLPGNTQNQMDFVANVYDRGGLIAMISGTMQRWEGTATRLKGQAEFPVYNPLNPGCAGILILLIIFLMVFFLQPLSKFIDITSLILVSSSCVGLLGILLVAMVIFNYYDHHRARRKLTQLFNEFFLFKAVP